MSNFLTDVDKINIIMTNDGNDAYDVREPYRPRLSTTRFNKFHTRTHHLNLIRVILKKIIISR